MRVGHTDGGSRELDAGSVFVFIGAQAQTGWLDGYVATDRACFVLTGADAAAAVGEGSQAVTFVQQHLAATFAATR